MSHPEDEEFTAYAAARWPALCRTAHLLTGDPSAAEDLAQATLVKVYVGWEKVRRADSIDAYVRRTMLNELLDGRRTQERRAARAHLALAFDEPLAQDSADRLDLWSQLCQLPPRQRAVIVLRYYEDLAEADIADALGVSPGTVKSQAHAALRTLRTRLDAQEVSS